MLKNSRLLPIEISCRGITLRSRQRPTPTQTLFNNTKFCLIFVATAGAEIFVCIISAILSVRLGFRAKAEVHKKNEGTFTVQILGEKDIIIHTTKESDQKYDELSEEQTDSTQSIERRTSDESASDQEKQPLDSSADTASVMLELQDTHM